MLKVLPYFLHSWNIKLKVDHHKFPINEFYFSSQILLKNYFPSFNTEVKTIYKIVQVIKRFYFIYSFYYIFTKISVQGFTALNCLFNSGPDCPTTLPTGQGVNTLYRVAETQIPQNTSQSDWFRCETMWCLFTSTRWCCSSTPR